MRRKVGLVLAANAQAFGMRRKVDCFAASIAWLLNRVRANGLRDAKSQFDSTPKFIPDKMALAQPDLSMAEIKHRLGGIATAL
jgi:hypothetical protein